MSLPTLPELLKTTVEMGGSDLHITTNTPPQVRVDGKLQPLNLPSMSPSETKQLVYSVLTDAQKKRFEENLELDFSFGIKGLARFRCNIFNQRGAVGARLPRRSPTKIRGFQELALPPVLAKLASGRAAWSSSPGRPARASRRRSRRCSTRSTPSAPSTSSPSRTRSSTCTRTRTAWSTSARCTATPTSFTMALRAALRQDPDVVLIGEMRDLETIEAALRIAETGHLTFATLHTNSAAQTINRIIDVFPAHQQAQIRAQLSLVLEGIVCQTLLPQGERHGPRRWRWRSWCRTPPSGT